MVDTNVLIYDYVEDSELHGRAEEILDSLDKWVVPAVVVYEFVWFLKGLGLKKSLQDVLQYLKNEKAEVICDYPEDLTYAAEVPMGGPALQLQGHGDPVPCGQGGAPPWPRSTRSWRKWLGSTGSKWYSRA